MELLYAIQVKKIVNLDNVEMLVCRGIQDKLFL